MTSARRTSSRPDGTTVRELPNDSLEITSTDGPPIVHRNIGKVLGVR